MFDKQAVDEYRSLSAPAELKARISQEASTSKRTPVRMLRAVGTIAACLAVIAVVAVLRLPSSAPVSVSTNGTLLSCTPVPMTVSSSARIQAEYYAMITLTADGKIAVQSDAVFGIRHEDDSLESVSLPYTASDELTLYWYVTSPDATLTVNGVRYRLYADEEHGTITIVQD